MAKIPSFVSSDKEYLIPVSNYSDWRRNLLRLHTFADEAWEGVQTILPLTRTDLSERRQRIREHLESAPQKPSAVQLAILQQSIRHGYLIAPESTDAHEVNSTRLQSELNGLATLIQKLDRRRVEERANRNPFSDPRVSELDDRLKRIEARQDEAAALVARSNALIEDTRKADLERKSEVEASKLASQRWFEERQVAFEAQSKDLEARLESVKDQLDKWFKDKEADISSAKEALRTSFATESAHTYWAKDKFKHHSDLATSTRRIGYVYMSVVLAAACLALYFGSYFSQPLWQTPLALAIPLAVVVVGVIWLGRILGRTYMAHVQLAEDAKERATMIETYIALIRADVIDKAKADEAQKALFRPASVGLLAGDSGPDTPIEVITKAVSGTR